MPDAVGRHHARDERGHRHLKRTTREKPAERRERRGPEERGLAGEKEAHQERAERERERRRERLRDGTGNLRWKLIADDVVQRVGAGEGALDDQELRDHQRREQEDVAAPRAELAQVAAPELEYRRAEERREQSAAPADLRRLAGPPGRPQRIEDEQVGLGDLLSVADDLL